MKKYLQVCTVVLLIGIVIYNFGYVVRNQWNTSVENEIKETARSNGKDFELYQNGKWKKSFLKGVNIGAAKPGYYPGEFGITKEDYKRWFKQIKEMNANVIRVYTLQMPAFYEALFEVNQHSLEPLYLMHGVWVDEETMQETQDAFHPDVIDVFKSETKKMIDILHGNAKVKKTYGRGYGTYTKDVSPYVVGYILGIEWDSYFVDATNKKHVGMKDFNGEWLYTKDAKPTEIFFADVANEAIDYETSMYKTQKPVAITNWLTTDVIEHKDDVDEANRLGDINTESIKGKTGYKSGLFASYHVYPYYPDFLNYNPTYIGYKDENGKSNSYRAYLKDLMTHHTVPVIVSEFGVPSSRGITHEDLSRGFNQGMVNEQQQGEMNKAMLEDIHKEGYAGAIVFSWQDEWFKRTWNTMDMDDPHGRAYWGDRMTNEEYFGLLSFDPGRKKSVAYVDGNVREWKKKDVISESPTLKLSMKSDESYVYMNIHKQDLQLGKEEVLIPIDITPNSGADRMNGYPATFNKRADFVISIKSDHEAEIRVQDYYNINDFLFDHLVKEEKHSPAFTIVKQRILGEAKVPTTGEVIQEKDVEVGKLIAGNGNPSSKNYDSLADFTVKEDEIEIRIPWLMLNVSNPAKRYIMDDFHSKKKIEHTKVENIHVGTYVVKGDTVVDQVDMKSFSWEEWDMPTSHERLKQSYYIMKDAFKKIR